MCYIDIMAPTAYRRYNKKLAHLFGLSGAAYLDALVEILDTVKRKNKFTDREMGFFTVDRKYITRETTLTGPEQKEFDALFESLQFLLVNPADSKQVSLDLGSLNALLSGVEEDEVKAMAEKFTALKTELKKEKKKSAAEGKKAGMLARWATWITGSDVVIAEFTKVLEMWYSRGIQTDAEITSRIGVYESIKDESLKLACLNKQLITGWTDPNLVVNKVTEDLKGNKTLGEQRVAVSIGDIKF